MRKKHRIVVKVGTSTLTNESGNSNLGRHTEHGERSNPGVFRGDRRGREQDAPSGKTEGDADETGCCCRWAVREYVPV